MANDWILDVLADLRDFAAENGLGISEAQLKKTLVVVANDLASMQEDAHGTARSMCHVGEFSRQLETGREFGRPRRGHSFP